nr:hypothetical protein [Tanacetum cinerariifolium]
MQDDLLNQMRNFMQNRYNGPPGEDKEHEAITDTELTSIEDIQPLPNQEPLQDFDIRQLIREECCVEIPEEQKQNMENTTLELVEICRHKEFLCMYDNVEDLIEGLLDTKLLSINSINSQRFDKKEQEVKNVVEPPAELAPILSAKEPKNSLSMGYEHLSITLETESDEVTESYAKNLLPILSECEVTSENKRECDVPVYGDSSTIDVCDNNSKILFNDDLSSNEESFEDIEYVDASLPDPEIASIEEENVVHQEEKEIDLEDIQDIVLREKLSSINRLIANIESLKDNPTPVCVFNSFTSIPILKESDNSLSLPEFETFCDHTEETRSGNTTTHANYSLPEYDSFHFEIEPDQENMNNIYDNSSNDPLLEEVDLFLATDHSIPPGIENFYDPERDIHFLEALLIDESSNDPSIPRPPAEPPDEESDLDPKVISVVMENIDEPNESFDPGGEIFVSTNNEDVDYFPFMFVIRIFLPYLIHPEISSLFLSAESEDTVFDLGISV